MKNIVLNVISIVIFLTVGFVTGYFWDTFSGCGQIEELAVQSDENTQVRSEVQAKNGTVISFVQKPLQRLVKPGAVYQQRATEEYVQDSEKKDLAREITADKSGLKLWTFNPGDSTAKEYVFEAPGRGFSLTATKDGGWIMKKDRFYWRVLMLNYEYESKVGDVQTINKSVHKLGLKTRLEYEDFLELEVSVGHDFNNRLALRNIVIGGEINLTIIK